MEKIGKNLIVCTSMTRFHAIRSETLRGASGSSVTYSYDGLGQLTSASVSNIDSSTWSISYSLGKDGNISSLTIGEDTVYYEYDSDGDSEDDSGLMTKIGDDTPSP